MSFQQSEIGLVDGAQRGGAIGIFTGSQLSFDACRLDGVAMLPISDSITIEVDRSVLSDDRWRLRTTLPIFYMSGRERLRVSHSLVTGRVGSLVTALSGARVTLEDSIVRDMRSPEEQPAASLDIATGGAASLARVRFVDDAAPSLSVVDFDSTASLTDVDVTSTSLAPSVALFVARGATLDASRLSIHNVRGAAVLLDGAGALPSADGGPSTRATVTDLFVSRVSHRRASLRGITGAVRVIRDAREHADVTLSEVGVSEPGPSAVIVNASLAELPAPVRLRTP